MRRLRLRLSHLIADRVRVEMTLLVRVLLAAMAARVLRILVVFQVLVQRVAAEHWGSWLELQVRLKAHDIQLHVSSLSGPLFDIDSNLLFQSIHVFNRSVYSHPDLVTDLCSEASQERSFLLLELPCHHVDVILHFNEQLGVVYVALPRLQIQVHEALLQLFDVLLVLALVLLQLLSDLLLDLVILLRRRTRQVNQLLLRVLELLFDLLLLLTFDKSLDEIHLGSWPADLASLSTADSRRIEQVMRVRRRYQAWLGPLVVFCSTME